MMKFYSNGEFPSTEKLGNFSQFIDRKAELGRSAEISERNYFDQFTHELKPINRQTLDRADYKNQMEITNTTSSDSRKSFYAKILKKHQKGQPVKLNHLENFRLDRKKQFAKEIELRQTLESNFQNQGNFVSKQQYLQSFQNSHEKEKKSDAVSRKNDNLNNLEHTLFLMNSKKPRSKSLHQKESQEFYRDNTPDWILTKRREIALPPRKKPKEGNAEPNSAFVRSNRKKNEILLLPPSPTTRYDRKKMAVIYKSRSEERGSQSFNRSNIDLSWIEDPKKQKFDRTIAGKIGFTNTPFIKDLEFKRNWKGYLKVGQPEVWRLNPKKDELFCKIAHNY